MSKAKINGSLKIFVLAFMLLLCAGMANAATFLPSTKYINIQTEFEQLEVTLEKFAPVDFIAHCPDFSKAGCPAWNIYNTTLRQNSSYVTFTVFNRGAYLGVHTPEIVGERNLTQIRKMLESTKNIIITKLNLTAAGLNLEFTLPIFGGKAALFETNATISLIGLKNETQLKNVQAVQINNITYNNEVIDFKTGVVAIDAKEFTSAIIQLPKSGQVNTIMKCAVWDFNSSSCSAWAPTSIPFKQDNEFIYFNVTSFSAYGGVELTLLTVQSYPQVGDSWTVRFLTKGTEELKIEGFNGTTYGEDLEFESLMCGDNVINVEQISNGIRVASYQCNTTSYHKVKVLTTGKHVQRITFGPIVAYAKNMANNMPNTISVEGKITNSTGDTLNRTTDITFRLYNTFTGGTRLWEENKSVAVDEGVFSVVLGSTKALDLNWNEPYFLAINVKGDSEMSPRINITSTPYAKSADRSFNLSCTDCIDETQIDTTGNFIMEGTLNMTVGVINLQSHKIINLAEPTASSDAATKYYVDTQLGGSSYSKSGWNDTGNLVKLITKSDNVNATTLFINNQLGRVGIGTSSPTALLTVNGNMQVNGNITSTNYGIEETPTAIVVSASGTKKLILTTNSATWK